MLITVAFNINRGSTGIEVFSSVYYQSCVKTPEVKGMFMGMWRAIIMLVYTRINSVDLVHAVLELKKFITEMGYDAEFYIKDEYNEWQTLELAILVFLDN